VNSKTGVVTLAKADIGLSLVDNLSVIGLGLGTNIGPLAADLNTTVIGGFFRTTSSTLNAPLASNMSVFVCPYNNGGCLQIASLLVGGSALANRMFYRTQAGGTWSLWGEFLTTGMKGVTRFTASGSWVVPTGVTQVWVSGVAPGGGGGGGGSGGGGSYYGAGGAGGGAGQSVNRSVQSVVPGQTIAITMGAPGAGAPASAGSGAAGTAGGNTTVTNLSGATLTLTGGGQGSGGASAAGSGFISGGGPQGSGFPFGMYGGDTDGTQPTCIGGVGGSSPFGGGGSGGRASTQGTLAGTAAGGFGAGGGGGGGNYSKGTPTYSGSSGGNGSGGLIIIEW
jgi:hypothetical protein